MNNLKHFLTIGSFGIIYYKIFKTNSVSIGCMAVSSTILLVYLFTNSKLTSLKSFKNSLKLEGTAVEKLASDDIIVRKPTINVTSHAEL